jgi:hypothetical protein
LYHAVKKDAWTGLWHVNCGVHAADRIARNWDEERDYGFLSAGQGPRWRDDLLKLPLAAPVYAYLIGSGYVAGGVVVSTAVRADDFIPPGMRKPLRSFTLTGEWFKNSGDPELSEYMIGVRWNHAVSPAKAVKFRNRRGTVHRIWKPDVAERLRAVFG